MWIFKEILSRHVTFLIAGLLFALLGLLALTTLPRSLFPELNYPRVLVEVNMGYAPLQVMEWSVTSILEKQLRAVPGVRLVKSTSQRGLSSIDVFLNETEEVTLAVQKVNAKISEARALIPPSAKITVRPITAAAFPAAEYCFTSKSRDLRELRTYVEYTIKPLILVIPGIFDVKVAGGDLPEFSVELDPAKMALHNLSAADINDRLKNSNGIDFLGPVETSDTQLLAFGGRFFSSPKELESIVVDSALGRPVTIGDLGHVTLRNEWKTKDVSLNGTGCVVLDVYYQSGIDQKASSVQVAATVNDQVASDPTSMYRKWDLNDFTDAATNAVLIDLIAGMIIIGLITLLFLRDLRFSAIALLSMPIAACLTFLAMARLGLSINLMTLGGLTAAIGLVVDNTVVILEMYHHRRTHDYQRSSRDVLLEVLEAIKKPMIFGTFTIALVFTPISYLSGVSGMFFSPMAHVHTSALMVSLVLALFMVPGLILLFDRKEPKQNRDLTAISNSTTIYRGLLAWALGRSKATTAMLLIVPLFGLTTLRFAETGFLPEWDEGDLVIDFRGVQPIGIATTVARIKAVEEHLGTKVPEIDFFIRKVGTGLGAYDKAPFKGEIIVKLKAERRRSVFEIKDAIGQEIGQLAPDLEFDLFQILPDRLNDLSGSAKPVVIHLHGNNDAKLERAAHFYKEKLSDVPGLDSLRLDEPERSPEFLFIPDESRARAIGLNPSQIDESVRFGLFNLDSSIVQIGPQAVPIRLRSAGSVRTKALATIPIYTSRGGLESVQSLGHVSQAQNRTESSHIDGAPVRTLTAEISGRDLGSVIKDVRTILTNNPIEGIIPDVKGDYELQQKSFRELMFAFIAGLAIIFLMSLIFSNRLSVALPITICSLVPPAVGLLGCVALHIPLDVSSFSGLISVTGVAVANAFMALTAIESIPGYRLALKEAVLTGMVSRLRPILMTNLAAMAGFVPIAIGLATGDEILRPFSIAIIAGLLGAVYTTLILIPIVYLRCSRPSEAGDESIPISCRPPSHGEI